MVWHSLIHAAALSGWSWVPHSHRWEAGYLQLQLYVTEYGHSKPPLSFVASDGYKLGNWVGNLRQNRARLTDDQVSRLEALPVWSWDPHTEQWEEGFGQLQSYVSLNSIAKVSRNCVTSDGFKLGVWVGTQRQKKSKNLLSQDRIECLEGLSGWSWDPYKEQWEEGFGQLQSYVNLNGDARVSRNCVTSDGFNLGSWAHRQRQSKSKNFLSQDRVERLEAISGWVWSFKKETE